MTDGKLDALRRDPAFAPLRDHRLRAIGRLVDLLDVVPGEVLMPADAPPWWGFSCSTGRLHVLERGRVLPQAVAAVLFLPEDLVGRALVAAAPSQVVVLPRTAIDTLLELAPALRTVPRYVPASRLPEAVR